MSVVVVLTYQQQCRVYFLLIAVVHTGIAAYEFFFFSVILY